MVAVGALNVGSILTGGRLRTVDPPMETNHAADDHWVHWVRTLKGGKEERALGGARGFALRKGEEVGMFSLGSTVVLVWEAAGARTGWWPWRRRARGFEMEVGPGDTVRMGQRLGHATWD